MNLFQYSILFSIICASIRGDSCSDPKIISNSFTTQDATIVTSIAYVAEFSVQCDTGKLTNLYADVDGVVSPIASTSSDSFQVSIVLYKGQLVKL